MASQVEEKAVEYLTRAERGAGSGGTPARARAQLADWVAYWGVKEAEWSAGRPEAAAEAAHVRNLLETFIAPALDRLEALPQAERDRSVNLMVPFDAEDGLRNFLLHFFQLVQHDAEHIDFQLRDPFEREVYILHDLYKVRKTLEVIETIRHASRNPGTRFTSRFTPDQQLSILNRFEEVLSLMFSQTLPVEHRQEIMDRISPEYLSAAQLLKRREAKLLYSYPHVLQRYDYRRFYFLIYFKEGLKARFEDEERTYRYNFLHFQCLKREFLVHWLESRLKGHSRKFKMYSQYVVRGKSLLEWITEDPERENELLLEMPTPDFHAMVGQIDEQLPAAERLGFEPETEKFGLYHRLKAQLIEATALVKAPIQTLRQIVADAESGAPPAPSPATPSAPAPPAPSPAPVAPRWEVTLLDKGRITQPFLVAAASGFNTQLAALRAKMGAAYVDLAGFAEKLFENTPEMAQVRRRTPRHEWTMPYHVKRNLPAEAREYLLVIGAEVKAKPRGMGYQAKESYSFTPYVVFAASRAEEGFGEPLAERHALGTIFHEYAINLQAVQNRCLEVLDAVREKSKI